MVFRHCTASFTQYGAVGQGNGVAVVVNRAMIVQSRHRTVAGQRPSTALLDCHTSVIRHGSAAFGVVHDVDHTGKCAAVFQGHSQGGDRVRRDIPLQGLTVGGKLHLRPVGPGGTPAAAGVVAGNGEQIPLGILIFQRHTGRRHHAVGIGGIERVTVFTSQSAAEESPEVVTVRLLALVVPPLVVCSPPEWSAVAAMVEFEIVTAVPTP